jgi:hypothetical protein
MIHPFIPNISYATYDSAPRVGLADATLMQCMSLPPDAWVANAPTAEQDPLHKGAKVAAIKLQPPKGFNPITFALPLCHISKGSPPNVQSSFTYNHLAVGKMSIGETGNQPLSLPENPTIGSITAASSAAVGFLSSPMLTYQALSNYDAWPQKKVNGTFLTQLQIKIENYIASFADTFAHDIGKDVDTCLPEGLESTGVGTIRDKSKVTSWPHFRLIDGAFTENTGAAFAIGKMQSDCESGLLDCRQGMKLVVISHNVPTDNQSSMRLLFTHEAGAPGQRLTKSSACPAASWTAPMPTIFNETYKSLTWKTYSTSTGSSTPSTYFVGTLTTVTNDFYNVKGGQKVKVALFNPNIASPIILPGSAKATQILTAGVNNAAENFGQIYAPMAEAQAKDAAPILKLFAQQ